MKPPTSIAVFMLLLGAASAPLRDGFARDDGIPRLASPTNLRATAQPPLQAKLSWDYPEPNRTSFVIEGLHKYRGWIRVALINPDHLAYAYKGIHPARTYRFRVRAFDATSISEPSNEVRVTATAGMKPASKQREDEFRPCQEPPKRGTRVSADPADTEEYSGVRREKLGAHRFAVWTFSECGNNCDDAVALWVRGCFRPVGSMNNAYLGLGETFYLGDDLGDWPLLLESSHASAREAGFGIQQLSGGEYRTIDSWDACGEFEGRPLTAAPPPFRECRQDDL